MPINPAIPMGIQPVQSPDLMQIYQNAQNIRLNQQRTQLSEMQLKEAQDKMDDDERHKKAWADSDGTVQGYAAKAKEYGVKPDTVMDYTTKILQYGDALAKKEASELKLHDEKMDHVRAMFMPIDEELEADPNSPRAPQMFADAYRAAEKQGLIDDQAKELLNTHMPKGFTREGYKMVRNGIVLGSDLIKEAINKQNSMAKTITAEAAARRTEAQIRNTENLILTRTQIADLRGLALQDQMERTQIARDTLAETTRRNLTSEGQRDAEAEARVVALDKTLAALKDRLVYTQSEQGKRQDKAIAATKSRDEYLQGKIDDRTQKVQDAITDRVKMSGKNATQAMIITKGAIALAKGTPGFDDLEFDQQIEHVNALIQNFGDNALPIFATQLGAPQNWWQEYGPGTPPSGPKVQPGAPIRTPGQAAPAGPKPEPTTGKRVRVTGPDGTGDFTVPEEQLDAYLKANPKAKKL